MQDDPCIFCWQEELANGRTRAGPSRVRKTRSHCAAWAPRHAAYRMRQKACSYKAYLHDGMRTRCARSMMTALPPPQALRLSMTPSPLLRSPTAGDSCRSGLCDGQGECAAVRCQGVASSGNPAFRDEGINDGRALRHRPERDMLGEEGSQFLRKRPSSARAGYKFLTIQGRVMEPTRIHCGGQTDCLICGGNAVVH
jgi:hypothetical protein